MVTRLVAALLVAAVFGGVALALSHGPVWLMEALRTVQNGGGGGSW